MLKVSMAKMRRNITKVLAASALLCAASVALGQSSSPAEIMKTRHQGMKDLGASFKTVRDQLRLSSPDMAAIKAAGENIKKTADLMGDWFPKGTGPESGIKTGAKAEIWSDAATFEKKRMDFVNAAGPFAELTATGDKAAISAAVRPLNGTCKGCHDLFFNDEH